jgi:hypothetical protein
MQGTHRIWCKPTTATIARSSVYLFCAGFPYVVELHYVLSGCMLPIQRFCRSDICGPGAEYLCCGKFLVSTRIYMVNQLLLVENSHADVLTHGDTSVWPIIQISNTFIRAYTTGIFYSHPCDLKHFIKRYIMCFRGCLGVDGSECVYGGETVGYHAMAKGGGRPVYSPFCGGVPRGPTVTNCLFSRMIGAASFG